jgi:hypothetical protein
MWRRVAAMVMGVVAVAAVVVVVAAAFAASSSPLSHHPRPARAERAGLEASYSVPASIGCWGDQSAALSSFLNSLPANSTVNFPKNGCYMISTTLAIHNKTGLTINGNGTRIYQDVPGPESSPVDPIMELYENTNLAINNVTVHGDYNGTNGGSYYEGDLGWLLEANHGVTLTGDTTEYAQGDCIELNSPDNSFITPGDVSLNTNVNVLNSTFNYCGYHGLSIEAANGALFQGDTFSNMGTDAMDFEHDIYSTGMSNGQPNYAAEENITISHDTWTTFGGDWFASVQGQTPGVAEHNVVLNGNTINSSTKAIEVLGTNPNATTAPYDFTNLTIENNTWSGSDPIDSSPSGMNITYVEGLTLRDNNFAFGYSGSPSLDVMQLNAVTPTTIEGNTFTGASRILYSASNGVRALKECGNRYGAGGSTLDSNC